MGLNPQDRPIKGGVGHFRLDYKLTDRLSLFVSTEYYGQNLNEIAGMPISRARHFAGVKIVLSRPPESESPTRKRGLPPDDSGSKEPGPPEEKSDGK
jgi:hypothetical protein